MFSGATGGGGGGATNCTLLRICDCASGTWSYTHFPCAGFAKNVPQKESVHVDTIKLDAGASTTSHEASFNLSASVRKSE